jgi:hypothetical protein
VGVHFTRDFEADAHEPAVEFPGIELMAAVLEVVDAEGNLVASTPLSGYLPRFTNGHLLADLLREESGDIVVRVFRASPRPHNLTFVNCGRRPA